MNWMKNRILRAALPLCMCWVIVLSRGAMAQTLNGAGSTFPYPLYQQWFAEYRKANPTVKVNYQAIGSGTGIQKIIDGSVDFAATEDPMTDQQLKEAKDKRGADILHFPIVMGAIVPIYNVPDVKADLNFTPAALAGIYLGKIKRWNDPEIAKANPDIKLRPDPIVVVRRQDGAGSTYLWTEFLSSVSPEWKAGPGKGMTVKWPIGLSAKGDEGVVGLVENTWDSIGYVELAYALSEHLPHGKIKNSAGNFVAATPESIHAAAGVLSHGVPNDLRVSFANAPGRDAYPISSFTWLLVPTKLKDPTKEKALAALVKWMLTEGQKSAEDLSYAKLPEGFVQKELERLNKLGK